MRCRFWEPGVEEETLRREKVLRQIGAWWKAFDLKRADLDALFGSRKKWDLPAWMEQHLQAIDKELMWEFGAAIHGAGHRLVITPEGTHRLRTLAQLIVERAPTFDGWEFDTYRSAESANVQAMVKSRTHGDVTGATVQVRPGKYRRVDLDFKLAANTGFDPSQLDAVAFVATECVAGEKLLDHWIGSVSVDQRSSDQRLPIVPLENLKGAIEKYIEDFHRELPSDPIWKLIDGLEWTMLKLNPPDEMVVATRSDVFLARTAKLDLWEAASADPLFTSERFSRVGETFCYVQMDGLWRDEKFDFDRKSKIEDSLDEALKMSRLGCIFGGTSGQRYYYFDLALTDLEAGITAIRNKLRSIEAPKSSWVRFFDTDLAQSEWVGIYPDTPRPADIT